MNYNRGCFRQPTPMPYRRQGYTEDMQKNNVCPRRDDKKDSYDVYETQEINYRLAMVYSPYQEWQNIYNGEKALENGTIFAELDKPFLGYKNNKGACIL